MSGRGLRERPDPLPRGRSEDAERVGNGVAGRGSDLRIGLGVAVTGRREASLQSGLPGLPLAGRREARAPLVVRPTPRRSPAEQPEGGPSVRSESLQKGSPGEPRARRAGHGATQPRTPRWIKASKSDHPRVANGKGARRRGDAGSAVAGGQALEGGTSVRKAGSRASPRVPLARNPANPRVGSGMQQARDPSGGASRQGGEKPRSRNESGRGIVRAEVGATPREHAPEGMSTEGRSLKNPVEGARLQPSRATRNASPNAAVARTRRAPPVSGGAWCLGQARSLARNEVRVSEKANDPTTVASGGGSAVHRTAPTPDRT